MKYLHHTTTIVGKVLTKAVATFRAFLVAKFGQFDFILNAV